MIVWIGRAPSCLVAHARACTFFDRLNQPRCIAQLPFPDEFHYHRALAFAYDALPSSGISACQSGIAERRSPCVIFRNGRITQNDFF
ncbi:hypothetical protein A6X21_13770 [Planctopirus hydrillae]|uniref:Uncharacterized protein n=1 Tax=Planctopirus hydrillae TaxID=1841610 RepID=A0A1C3E3W8_9PLAN|nr:hypothetical protein A6X21_13770 [Planctopirus hydrillae]